jgi:signal transduction histidine kinase/DNA-binding NarL/FixJ family response regulator
MNLFWQITMVEFLLNVAMFAGAVIFYGPIRLLAARLARGREFPERLASGVLFGMATSATLFLPVHLEGGAAVGCSTILLALAGPLDGPLAIFGGLVFSVSLELLPWVAKDESSHAAIFSLLVAAAVSTACWGALKYNPLRRNRRLAFIDLPIIGALFATGSVALLGASEGRAAALSAFLPALLSNIFAAFILGTLLLHEKHRSETERDLRESEAHLAGQAKELALARDTAESANRAKSTFLASMSHELRTPLNAILGYAQLLLRKHNLTPSQVVACRTIQQSGEHLLMLIVDILDLAKIEAGKLELQLGAVDLRVFLHGIANIIAIRAENKALEFACTLAPDLPAFVQADDKRLRQILLNLLSNAVKFTDHGRVDLQVKLISQSATEVRLSFAIKDTGTGILHEQLEKVFRRFEQVGSVQQRAGGTGLGLSICRQLAHLMGSEIQVESTWGQGSCFWFVLSTVPIAAGLTPDEAGGTVVGYEGPRKRLLVVDDIEENRLMMSEFLMALGFDVPQATNGLEALANAQSVAPDLILTDVLMPVMGGLELMFRMQELPELCQIPVIAISAGVTDEKRRECMAAGATAFVTKPIDVSALVQAIGRLLHLTWIREVVNQGTAPESEVIELSGIPEPEQMEALRALAKAGNMRAIREKAKEIWALSEHYHLFANRITTLAIGYESQALLRLVQKCAEQQQKESVEQVTTHE